MFDKRLQRRLLTWAKKIRGIRMLGGKCKCGVNNPLLLEFHHEKENKESTINMMRGSRWSKLEEEISKCRLFCSNCHREFHTSIRKNTDDRKVRLKKKLLEMKGVNSCMRCGYSGVSLEFHHVKDKKFDLWSYVFNRLDIEWDEVLLELDKCSVLCCNCHRLEHWEKDFMELMPLIEEKLAKYKERPPTVDKKIVLDLYGKGVPQIEIARRVHCSESTVSVIVNGA